MFIEFAADKKFLFTETFGGGCVWNFAENRFVLIPQRIHTNKCEINEVKCIETNDNSERTFWELAE